MDELKNVNKMTQECCFELYLKIVQKTVIKR